VLYKEGKWHCLGKVHLVSSQQPFSLPSFLFLLPTFFVEHAIAASILFCLYDADNILTNTMIEFDYEVSSQLFEYVGSIVFFCAVVWLA
jgi:hypothetical protein